MSTLTLAGPSAIALGAAKVSSPSAPSVERAQPKTAVIKTASPAKKIVFNLSGYQDQSGLIGTFENGDAADPYFGLYALELAHRAGLDVTAARNAFIEWGLKEQREDGRFERYCKEGKAWKACGRSDSDDATLSRWMVLLARASTQEPMPAAWQQSYDKAEATLAKLKMSNGVYSVFTPDTKGYAGYALFTDNVEVLNAFQTLAAIYEGKGDKAKAEKYAHQAQELTRVMHAHFGEDPLALKTLALGAKYDKIRFYPHKVAAPISWMEGYGQASDAAWQQWLAGSQKDWKTNAQRDYPWGILAVSAMDAGRKDVACQWLKDYANYKVKNIRWNVLEETSAQVLIERFTQSAESCKFTLSRK